MGNGNYIAVDDVNRWSKVYTGVMKWQSRETNRHRQIGSFVAMVILYRHNHMPCQQKSEVNSYW